MTWSEIRNIYPEQWLVVEALASHVTPEQKRELDQLAVVEMCLDGASAMSRYRHLHQQFPQREFYFLHTSRQDPDIHVRRWLGVRTAHAAGVSLAL